MQGHYESVIAHASQLVADAVLSQEGDLEQRALGLDVEVKELMRQIGRQSMEQILSAVCVRVSKAAEEAGLKVNRRVTARFSVVFGQVELPSPYHWDPVTKRSMRPVQCELGITSRGRSLGVERALTDFGAEESFGQASARFEEHYGWEVGRTTVLRVVEERAGQAEVFVEQRLRAAEAKFDSVDAHQATVEQVLLELDGCELRTGSLVRAPGRGLTPVRRQPRRKRIEAWRDVRVGLAGPLDAPDERTYVARLAPYNDVVRQLFAAACNEGMSSQTRVIAVADGGNGLREELDAQFPKLQFILDRPHLEQHFYETADALGLAGDARHTWVAERLHLIDEGRARDVIAELRKHRGRGKKRVARLVKYVTRFADAVFYNRYREDGLPVGSGEIESCHRWLPQKRLKLPGAWWTTDNLNRMLALRVLRANGWWQAFWDSQATPKAA